MLTAFKRLKTSKGAATVAALSLALVTAGVAGAVTLPDDADQEAKDRVAELEAPADEIPEPTNEHEGDGEGEGPAAEANETAHSVYEYITTTDDEGCEFGLGVAAIASNGQAPAAEDVCNENAGTENAGEETSSARADNANRGLDTASDASSNENAPSDVPAGDADNEVDHPDAESNPGDGFRQDG